MNNTVTYHTFEVGLYKKFNYMNPETIIFWSGTNGQGAESKTIERGLKELIYSFCFFPISQLEKSLVGKFYYLMSVWKAERGPYSTMSRLAMHPAYQQIIGMGPVVIPLILEQLNSEEPDHWFWALRSITGEDPILPEHRGKLDKMAADWIQWGKEKGFTR